MRMGTRTYTHTHSVHQMVYLILIQEATAYLGLMSYTSLMFNSKYEFKKKINGEAQRQELKGEKKSGNAMEV